MLQVNIALVKEFVDLENRRGQLDEDLKEINKRRAELKAILLEQFTDAGVQNMSVDGRSVYMLRQLWASADQDAHPILRKYDLGWTIAPKVNTQTLSAELRDWEREGREIPSELREAISIKEKFDIRSRRT